MSPSQVMVFKLSKIVFFAFFAGVSKTSKAAMAVYEYALESSHFTFLENGIGYYAITYSLEDFSV